MNKQEVEALAAKLTRIWRPETFTWSPYDWIIDGEAWKGISYEAELDAKRNIALRAHISIHAPYFCIFLNVSPELPSALEEFGGVCCWLGAEVELTEWTQSTTETYAHLVLHHLPQFRRNCWLLGIPLNASMHEKAEWLQDLTPEEIASWNLSL